MCRSSGSERPISSLGACSKTDEMVAFERESPDANIVTSWPCSTSPSASSETIHSIPP